MFSRDPDGRRLALDHLERGFAQHSLNFSLELAHARLARVLADQPLEGAVRHVGTLGLA